MPGQVRLHAPPGRTRQDVAAAALLVQAVRIADSYPLLDRLEEDVLPLFLPDDDWPELRRLRVNALAEAEATSRSFQSFLQAIRAVLEGLGILSNEVLLMTVRAVGLVAAAGGNQPTGVGLLHLLKRGLLVDRSLLGDWWTTIRVRPPLPWEKTSKAESRMKASATAIIEQSIAAESQRRAQLEAELRQLRENNPRGRRVVPRSAVKIDYFTAFLLNQNPELDDDAVLNEYERIHPKAGEDTFPDAVLLVSLLSGIPLRGRRIN